MEPDLEITVLRNPRLAPVHSERPRGLGIEVTGRCNLRCRHCFNESSPENPHELPLEVIEKILSEAEAWGLDAVRITGGEATVHASFREIVAACQRRGLAIDLNTNGVYSVSMLKFLQTAPIRRFLISLDGLRANNDAIRGRGIFAKVLASTAALRGAGQSIVWSFHIGRGNHGDLEGLAAMASEQGVGLKVSPLRPIGRAVTELPDALIQPSDYLGVVRRVVKLRELYPAVRFFTDFDILTATTDEDCTRNEAGASCQAGRTMVNVGYDGQILPCGFFHTGSALFSAGSVYDTPIGDVWSDAPAFAPFRIHTKSERCQGCRYYQKRCAGGCPAIAHFSTGQFDAHDPTCFADLVQPPGVGVKEP